jgi:hypothetical protein
LKNLSKVAAKVLLFLCQTATFQKNYEKNRSSEDRWIECKVCNGLTYSLPSVLTDGENKK